MDESLLKELLEKYRLGTCSEEERVLLESWYLDRSRQKGQEADLDSLLNAKKRIASLIETHTGVPLPGPTKTKVLWPRIAAVAASVLIVTSIGGYLLLHNHKPVQQTAQNQPVDIKPGSNKAILTLANGQKISLTDAQNGQLAKQNNTVIKKTADGRIIYATDSTTNNNTVAAIQYNTISTVRGGQWPEIKLPDGTRVRLDASSSIRYPVQFTGKDRIVEVTGHAYFKVKFNKDHPFKTTVAGQTINDLGTEFDINAYTDEPVIRTTLIEGGIMVVKNGRSATLVPGQQAVTMLSDNSITVKDADIEETTAWLKGQTSFKNEDIQEIMRQVSRWYDVDVEYEGKMPDRKFMGGVDRNATFPDFLKILSFNNIHYTVTGKRIIIKP